MTAIRIDRRTQQRYALTAAAVIAVIAVVVVTAGADAIVIGVISGATYGFFALGLVLIYKSSGAFNFAQGEFATVALFALWIAQRHLPYGLAIVAALVAAVVMGLVVERLVVRPLFDAPRVTLLVATAGVALLAVGLEFWLSGDELLKRVEPIHNEPARLTLAGIQISDQQVLLVLALVAFAVLLALFFNRTNLGLAILGASQEPTATELIGVSVRRLSSLVWALAALLGAVAGILAGPIAATFGPGAFTLGGTAALIPGFTAAVIGGMTSMPGAFVGGTIVGVAQAAAPDLLPQSVDNPGTALVFILLIAILTIKPTGLLGKSA